MSNLHYESDSSSSSSCGSIKPVYSSKKAKEIATAKSLLRLKDERTKKKLSEEYRDSRDKQKQHWEAVNQELEDRARAEMATRYGTESKFAPSPSLSNSTSEDEREKRQRDEAFGRHHDLEDVALGNIKPPAKKKRKKNKCDVNSKLTLASASHHWNNGGASGRGKKKQKTAVVKKQAAASDSDSSGGVEIVGFSPALKSAKKSSASKTTKIIKPKAERGAGILTEIAAMRDDINTQNNKQAGLVKKHMTLKISAISDSIAELQLAAKGFNTVVVEKFAEQGGHLEGTANNTADAKDNGSRAYRLCSRLDTEMTGLSKTAMDNHIAVKQEIASVKRSLGFITKEGLDNQKTTSQILRLVTILVNNQTGGPSSKETLENQKTTTQILRMVTNMVNNQGGSPTSTASSSLPAGAGPTPGPNPAHNQWSNHTPGGNNNGYYPQPPGPGPNIGNLRIPNNPYSHGGR